MPLPLKNNSIYSIDSCNNNIPPLSILYYIILFHHLNTHCQSSLSTKIKYTHTQRIPGFFLDLIIFSGPISARAFGGRDDIQNLFPYIFLTQIAITWVLQLYFFYPKFCKILISKETKALLLRNHHALGHLFRHPAVVSEGPRCAQHVEQVAELLPREARELRNSFPELFGLRRSYGPAMDGPGPTVMARNTSYNWL